MGQGPPGGRRERDRAPTKSNPYHTTEPLSRGSPKEFGPPLFCTKLALGAIEGVVVYLDTTPAPKIDSRGNCAQIRGILEAVRDPSVPDLPSLIRAHACVQRKHR